MNYSICFNPTTRQSERPSLFVWKVKARRWLAAHHFTGHDFRLSIHPWACICYQQIYRYFPLPFKFIPVFLISAPIMPFINFSKSTFNRGFVSRSVIWSFVYNVSIGSSIVWGSRQSASIYFYVFCPRSQFGQFGDYQSSSVVFEYFTLNHWFVVHHSYYYCLNFHHQALSNHVRGNQVTFKDLLMNLQILVEFKSSAKDLTIYL